MATLTHKTTLLLAPEDYDLLRQESQARRTTIGELVREAIRKTYRKSKTKQSTKAWEKLFKAKAPVADWDQMEKEIDQGRLL